MSHYVFQCPNCGAETVVDDAVRTMLADEGCVVCGTRPTPDAFTARNDPDEQG